MAIVEDQLAALDGTSRVGVGDPAVDAELAGLDALEIPVDERPSFAVRLWAAAWPKLLAVAIVLGVWQIVVWSGWRPEYVLPSPATVLKRFFEDLSKGTTWEAIYNTMKRAATGYTMAVIIGTAVGLAVTRFKPLRAAIGSLITGIQTMPSIAWFPLAILLFHGTEGSIMFVVVIGAAPAIANGVISGVDHIPPLWLRAGRVLGAKNVALYRHVVLPAVYPAFVGGLKQGWAFAWRSLMAGELLVIIANKPSIGSRLEFERQFADAAGLMSVMLIVLVLGILVDALIFGRLDRRIRRRRGLEA
jgi:NitT/TauT family transport system permease protein